MSVAQVPMAQISCYRCAIVFWVPASFQAERREDQEEFWCPNGHRQAYVGETEAQKLRKQLERAQSEKDAALRRAVHAEIEARNPPLSETQLSEAQWLRDNVKGVGWTRAQAIIREYGRVRTFAEAGDSEVAEAMSTRLGATVSLNFARELIHRTQVAIRTHGKKLLPAMAGPSNP